MLVRLSYLAAHPTPQGHSWLAQLIVHALRTAASLSPADAKCAERQQSYETLPPPTKLLSARTAAHGGNSSACLHGTSLATVLVENSGFTVEGGHKPGLRASRAGSYLRLVIHLPAGERGTWVHLGYLQSWRRDSLQTYCHDVLLIVQLQDFSH